jgi:peptidoglycan-N-acetylglucosamine deacetylase
MAAEQGSSGVTRRVLLTAGGLTLLGICVANPARHATTTARPTRLAQPTKPPARPPAGPPAGRTAGPPAGPAAGPAATPSPARAHPVRTEPPSPEIAPVQHGSGGTAQTPMFTVDDGPHAIALTIDDGPSPVYTPQVLALLARYRVTATFSMIGIEVQTHPGVAREVADAGHVIANHTWSHPDLARLPPAVVTEQMSQATEAIHAATGRIPDLFRAPYGAWSPFVLAQCARAGLTPLDWSVDPRDWSRPGVAAIVANIMRNTRTGSIILEHDGGGDRSQTVAALKIVIPRLLAAGYHFHTP